MFRQAAIVVSIVLLAFTTACGSHKSSSPTSSAGGSTAGSTAGAGAPVSSSQPCPTHNTKSFAKTRFVADAALAGGAFKHWIYTPMKEGKFQKGAHGRVGSIVKAVAAGAFTLNRLNAAKNSAAASPLLCKYTIAPITRLRSSISTIVHQGNHGMGSIDSSSVTSANSVLSQFHSGAASGGAGFTDNQNANIGG